MSTNTLITPKEKLKEIPHQSNNVFVVFFTTNYGAIVSRKERHS